MGSECGAVKLTRDDNPETIRRYAHLRRGRASRQCAVELTGDRYTCTREQGHRGPHAAHGWFSRVVAVWTADTLASPPDEPKRPRRDEGRSVRRGGRPVGLPTRSPSDVVARIRSLVVGIFSSFDQIAFVLLFAVFVWFAIEVLLRLY